MASRAPASCAAAAAELRAVMRMQHVFALLVPTPCQPAGRRRHRDGFCHEEMPCISTSFTRPHHVSPTRAAAMPLSYSCIHISEEDFSPTPRQIISSTPLSSPTPPVSHTPRVRHLEMRTYPACLAIPQASTQQRGPSTHRHSTSRAREPDPSAASWFSGPRGLPRRSLACCRSSQLPPGNGAWRCLLSP